MAEELKNEGIKVGASRKGHDGLAHISVCGASTGKLNVYSIARESLPKARALGFKLLVSRPMAIEIRGWAPARRAGPQIRATPRQAGPSGTQIPQLW